MKRMVLSAVWAFFFLAGCATNRVDWSSRIGKYTYDQAVEELGVPDRSATLTNGSTVAEWLRMRGATYGSFSRFPGSRLQTYDLNQMPDSYLRLVFGPDGRLVRQENFAR